MDSSKADGKGTSTANCHLPFYSFWLHPLISFITSFPEEQKNSYISPHLLLFLFMCFSTVISTGICMA